MEQLLDLKLTKIKTKINLNEITETMKESGQLTDA